jgi:hypothetical protein
VLLIRALRRGPPADVPEAQLALADARWRIAARDASAIALAEDARAGFATLGAGEQARVDDVDRWLARRR